MRITASDINVWVDSHAKDAQTQLPRWVRRLCFDSENTQQISFPAGDSTFIPGWDGVLLSKQGNTWVPSGPSRWEIGCDKNILSKANGDYEKRTLSTTQEERLSCVFVFVTPRRWLQKSTWIRDQLAKSEWADVRAYDADDLEQWLEQTPAVALLVAEEIGLSGHGVVSPAKYWQSWSQQCNPAITPDALFMDRSETKTALSQKFQALQDGKCAETILALRADSVEEAAAFAVAVVMSQGNFSNECLVVTDTQGWQFVETNVRIKIVVVAKKELAISPTMRSGLLVIVPHATGDITSKKREGELVLERPKIYDFERSLVAIGLEESDAKRYASSTGRSWTILRRQRAINPAIQNPLWLELGQSSSLPLLCLIGCWHANHVADRQALEGLARRPYEDVEEDLARLTALDDAPILKIGDVWKAKSPLELMNQFGGRITHGQLNRFFVLAEQMLTATDPQLDLPPEERWLANVRGKVHPYSKLLFDSVCDSLLKLAVRGVEMPSLQSLCLENRVNDFVQLLLKDASAERWLSLSSYLPTLAEAAPDVFLTCVEKSLRYPESPVCRLIIESDGAGQMGRCWHAGLLWALETLAWAPNRLARVALILARLTHVPMAGNWGNTPGASLYGLFRSWYPQTAASVQDRINVLKLLVKHDGDVAFGLLKSLCGSVGTQVAIPARRPEWREDDAGAGHGVTRDEMSKMEEVAAEQIILLSSGNVLRIAELLSFISFDSPIETAMVLRIFDECVNSLNDNEHREILRSALRRLIYRRRNFSQLPEQDLVHWLRPLEMRYESLQPHDPVLSCRWLFDNYSVDLPYSLRKDRENFTQILWQERNHAIARIFEEAGMSGIERLILTAKCPSLIGQCLSEAIGQQVQWVDWILNVAEDLSPSPITQSIAGLLMSVGFKERQVMLEELVQYGKSNNWVPEKFARLFNLLQSEKNVWMLADSCGSEVAALFWKSVQPYCFNGSDYDENVARRLLEARRPNAALRYCEYCLDKVDASFLFEALQQVFIYEEDLGSGPIEYWHLTEMLKKLEQSKEIDREHLFQLEFQLFPLFGHDDLSGATVLYDEIMSRPELFVELLCALYKPEHGERLESANESGKAIAKRAWDIFRKCTRLPGVQMDGSINGEEFSRFVVGVRELCRAADRATMGDQTLGQILAHSPADDDGAWPFIHARVILDQSDAEEIRNGFRIGVFNKRGVTTRSPWEGGSQERDLASHYRVQARKVQSSHPNVSGVLETIASSYERMGSEEDIEANLRKEGL